MARDDKGGPNRDQDRNQGNQGGQQGNRGNQGGQGSQGGPQGGQNRSATGGSNPGNLRTGVDGGQSSRPGQSGGNSGNRDQNRGDMSGGQQGNRGKTDNSGGNKPGSNQGDMSDMGGEEGGNKEDEEPRGFAGGSQGRDSAGDVDLTNQVNARLLYEGFETDDMEVRVDHGVVCIGGSQQDEDPGKISQCIRSIKGVKDVRFVASGADGQRDRTPGTQPDISGSGGRQARDEDSGPHRSAGRDWDDEKSASSDGDKGS